MRMSRIRQRRLLLQQRRQASHNRQKAAAAVLGSLAVSVPQQSNAALNVLQDINNDFDYMIKEGNLKYIFIAIPNKFGINRKAI